LSFRERAAKGDVKLPSGLEDEPPVTTPTKTGVSLTRAGSNKLKKSPPGDPWLNKKMEAERYISGNRRPQAPSAVADPKDTAGGAGVKRVDGGSVRTRVPDIADSRSGNKTLLAEEEDVKPSPAVARLSKSPNMAKAEKILGTKIPPSQKSPSQRTTAEKVVGAGAAAVATAAAVKTAASHHARRDTRAESDTDDEDDPHVSDVLYPAQDTLKPGQGAYKHPTYLEEWKKAPVGALTGPLIDLSSESGPSVKRLSAWWETPPSQRRGSLSSRPRKAEAFDGEYDDTLGM
jgi:hypothetical protein